MMKLHILLVFVCFQILQGFNNERSFASADDDFGDNNVDRVRRSAEDNSVKMIPMLHSEEGSTTAHHHQQQALDVDKRLPRLGRSPFPRLGEEDEEEERDMEKRLPRLGLMSADKRLPRLGVRAPLPRLGKRLPRLGDRREKRLPRLGLRAFSDDEVTDEDANGTVDKRLPRLGMAEDRRVKRLPRLGKRSTDDSTQYVIDVDEDDVDARSKRLPRLGRSGIVDQAYFDDSDEVDEDLDDERIAFDVQRLGFDKRLPRLGLRASPFPRIGERAAPVPRLGRRASPFPRLGF